MLEIESSIPWNLSVWRPAKNWRVSEGHREWRNTHAPRTHTALRDSPLLPPKSASNTDAPGGEEWHDAMLLPRKKTKRKTTTGCAARGKERWKGERQREQKRVRERERIRTLQLQPRSCPWIARRNYYEHVMHNWLRLIFPTDCSSQREARNGRHVSFTPRLRLSRDMDFFSRDLMANANRLYQFDTCKPRHD